MLDADVVDCAESAVVTVVGTVLCEVFACVVDVESLGVVVVTVVVLCGAAANGICNVSETAC